METAEMILTGFFILLIGACIGSFLNVAALRAISGESIVFPPSKCPLCGSRIKWYDNIPVFSYLFTFRGKCRSCGEKVSIQYPVVEALTAVLFLFIYTEYGVSIKSLLLLILLCISIIICITDIKKEYVFDAHSWILIIAAIAASLYINGLENYSKPAFGIIAGVIAMEGAARLSYYLIRKKNSAAAEKSETESDNSAEKQAVNTENTASDGIENEAPQEHKSSEQGKTHSADIDDENFSIEEYINDKKRAFGEGDTYLAAAAGALLGWKYLLLAVFLAVILQALCVLPGFASSLYKRKQYETLISMTGFFGLAALYFIVSNIIELHLYAVLAFAALLSFAAVNTINRLKETPSGEGFYTIPFGPAILICTFTVFFAGEHINSFLQKYIFS